MDSFRSKKYTDGARDQSCVNCGATGSVVACHIQGMRAQEFGKGRGMKPSDLCTADLCGSCHERFDHYGASDLDTKHLRQIDMSEQWWTCVMRTIHRRVRQGLIKIK